MSSLGLIYMFRVEADNAAGQNFVSSRKLPCGHMTFIQRRINVDATSSFIQRLIYIDAMFKK